MALKEKHRSSIYQSLVPMLGEEETEDLLAQFPARDLDSPVTKEYLGQELAKVRTEMANLRTEVAILGGGLDAKIERVANRTIVILISAFTIVATVGVSVLSVVITNAT